MHKTAAPVNPPEPPIEQRYAEIIALLVEDRLSFQQAVVILELSLDARQIADISRRKEFRRLYNAALRSHYEVKGAPTETTKTAMVGAMLEDARHLRNMGKYKEAGELTSQAARIMGYTSADTNISLYGDISGADIARLKEQIAERRRAAEKTN